MLRKNTLALSLVALITACSQEAPQSPLVEVIVDTAKLVPYRPNFAFIGRLEAEDDVNIQAKVSGYLTTRSFLEGEEIKKGDELFRIDPASYEATLARQRAELAKARANLEVAARNFKRGEELVGRGAISQSEMDNLRAVNLQAEAEVLSAEANVKSAQVDLDDTVIRAPIDGRIGRSEHSVGDLVGPTIGNLTTLASLDPMKATFQINEADFISYQQNQDADNPEDLLVKVELSNREIYDYTGHIDYISNRIDADTGTIEMRASIPNPDHILRPGQYVRVIIEPPDDIEVLMVPQAAIQADQQGSYVLTIAPGNTVARKNVITSDRVDDLVIVQGVQAGEQVVVRGLQQVRTGMPVKIRQMPPRDEVPPESPDDGGA